ncbi:MAG: hypothetical protein QXX09_02140, partial [Candidatus Methanomethylicia archaeon]
SIILFSIFSGGQIQIILGLMNLVNVSNLHNYWQNHFFINFFLYGGFQSNIFTLITALPALFIPSNDFGMLFLKVMVFASSIPYPLMGSGLQSRILFNLPLEILSSFFIYRVYCNETLGNRLRYSLLSFSILSQLNYLFRCLANVI